MIDPSLLLMLVSFPPSLFLLSFIFSGYLGTRGENKSGISGRGLMISLAGLSMASVLLLAAPVFPRAIPVVDLAVTFAAATWIVLLRRYSGGGWLETLPQAILPVIIYVVVLAISSAFVLLFSS